MSNLESAQTRMESLARWLDKRDHYTDSLAYDLDKAQAQVNRITNQAIDATLRNLERFIERASLDSQDTSLSARHRQMARTDLKRLNRTKRELERLQ